MTVLAADRNTPHYSETGYQLKYDVIAADIVFKGAIVSVASGAQEIGPAADTANDVCQGIALQQADNSGGAAGDEQCLVANFVAVDLVASGITAADVGKTMYVVDDQTVTNAATATNDVAVGRLLKLTGTVARVFVTGAVSP